MSLPKLTAVCFSIALFASIAVAQDPVVEQQTTDPIVSSDATQAPVAVDATVSDVDCCHELIECCQPVFVPNMIGDALALPVINITSQGSQFSHLPVVRPSTNNSPYPRDRFSVEYRQYVDAFVYQNPNGNTGGPVDSEIEQYTIRWEKTFCCGQYSVDVIVPLIDGPRFDQTAGDQAPSQDLQFGDLTVGLKGIICQDACKVISAGLQIEAPTAGNIHNANLGAFAFSADRDEWHFTPYLAAAYTPNECLFAQAFVGYRVATSDMTIRTPGVGPIHNARSPDAVMVDLGIGYWLDGPCCGPVCRWAPTVELHYYGTTENHQYVSTGNLGLVNTGFGTVDYVNLTVGANAELCNGGTLAAGFVFPTRSNTAFIPPTVHNDSTDRFYDWQFVLQYNHFSW